ncbi:hypothetical protein LTR12_013468 [Friedmanniomyces endolithicus]|nr:hypothetical protein LTR74_006119 [Friedmanniomyces endolithicus]KAK1812135.1 hypothetical protein LTR12_013468 [Friedmanniomyces endolithicus]
MAASEVIEIAPHGDVLLLCGEQVGEGKIVGLRVNSHIMSHGSSVFKTLLGSKFREGTALATSSMVEISLPEDHPILMVVLCNIFHMRNDHVLKLDAISLKGLAQLCDKYDCALVASLAVERYILAALPSAKVDTLANYLDVAVTLHCMDAVNRIAVALVHQATNPITEFIAGPISVTLSLTCAEIDKTIRGARRDMSVHMESLVEEQLKCRRSGFNGCEMNCNVGKSRVFGLLTQLVSLKLWGTTNVGVNLEAMLRTMETIRLHDPDNLIACDVRGGSCAINTAQLKLDSYNGAICTKALLIRRTIEAVRFS